MGVQHNIIDDDVLDRMGFEGYEQGDREIIAALLRKELEERVGESISDAVGTRAVDEFGAILDGGALEAAVWIARYMRKLTASPCEEQRRFVHSWEKRIVWLAKRSWLAVYRPGYSADVHSELDCMVRELRELNGMIDR